MKKLLTGAAALMMTTAPVLAGGIERAPQSLSVLFEKGNYVEFSAGRVNPTVSGTDLPIAGRYPGGRKISDVAEGYNFFGFAYKHQFNDNLSAAVIVEQPYGADVSYAPVSSPLTSSLMFAGTNVEVNSTTYTAILRYKFENGFGVHGGLRGSQADGSVNLRGVAYGPLGGVGAGPGGVPVFGGGYKATLDSAWGWGYAVGVSYEKPEIAARVSLTYNSPIDHDFDTAETLNGNPLAAQKSTTTVTTPRSWNLEGQTGIAPDTLLYGSIRWVKWSEFAVAPRVFSRTPTAADPVGFGQTGGLVELEDSTTYTLGVARKFNDTWSGAMSITHEPKGSHLVSPLSPTNGRTGVSLAAIYNQGPMKITTGISYFKLGDADPETGTPDVARARMRDSDAIAVGIKVGYSF